MPAGLNSGKQMKHFFEVKNTEHSYHHTNNISKHYDSNWQKKNKSEIYLKLNQIKSIGKKYPKHNAV